MKYDLVIKNGTVIDGSGMPRYRADVGVVHGRVASIGRIRDAASEVIDAEGHIVTPGFIDGHTHMDAQVSWDPLGTCSCWHGVTSVLMGNCGFTLAPVRKNERELVVRNLERAEDISPAAMEAGIDWTWETFPEYLDTVENLPKGINYGCYVGHSALRTYVMGERAFDGESTADDIELMRKEVRDSIRAGAMGFTTSRTRNHLTADGRAVSSRLASWDEVRALVGVMGEMNAGVFEIASEDTGRDPAKNQDYRDRLKALAVDTGRPITFGMFSPRKMPDYWRPYFDLLEDTAAAGGRMFTQVHSRALNTVMSFQTRMPFDGFPVWEDIRKLPLSEQKVALQDPATRAKLVDVVKNAPKQKQGVGAESRRPEFDWIFVMDKVPPPHRSVAEVARERGLDPIDCMIQLTVEHDMELFFLQPIANEDQDHVLEMMKHPRSVVTFSDSGAHVSQIMDSSLQTHVFSHWVRDKQAFDLEEAVKMLTFEPASSWSLPGRGLLREGFAADINVINPDTIGPQMPVVRNDLPAGAQRLVQKADGIAATIVNGNIVLRNGEHTGALPGKLLRGPLAAGR